MNIIASNKSFLILLTIFVVSIIPTVQAQNVSVNQDPKFEQLLNEKRKANISLTVNDSYKIQLYSGGNENARKTLYEFKQEFRDIDATIVFNTPNYKVWVGNFKTRIEAERALIDIRKKYQNTFLIKPTN